MGKGDKKSKRGKIALGSYGNSRRRRKKRTVVASEPSVQTVVAEEPAPKPRKTARKKTEA